MKFFHFNPTGLLAVNLCFWYINSMFKRTLFSFILLFIFLSQSWAKAPEELESFLEKYRKAPFIKAALTKTITSNLMGTSEVLDGNLEYSQGKMKLKITNPKKEALIFDGKIIWTVQAMPKELGGKIHITKSKVDDKSKAKIILRRFFEKNSLDKEYNIKNITQDSEKNNFFKFSFVPIANDPNLKKIEITFEKESHLIHELKYWDEVENEISYVFKTSEFLKNKPEKNYFTFKIPKNAEVVEL